MKNWPKNSTGQWSKAKKDLTAILIAMTKGSTLQIDAVRAELEVTKSQIRGLMWGARQDAAKQPDGGVFKVSFEKGTIYRKTDDEASEGGKHDANKGRRHFRRSSNRLTTVNTASLGGEQTKRHRLYEAQISVALSALSPQKRAGAARQLANGKIDAGNLAELFR